MAEVLLFHHALGQTPGFLAFADELRAGGHTVHAPDLYDGNTFDDLDGGMGYAREVGFDQIMQRGVSSAADLPSELVYAGFSLGVMSAQQLAQTRAGALGLLSLHSAIPPEEFGSPWPDALPLQIHTMEGDEWGDVDVAKQLVEQIPSAELFLYPGDRHLFSDSSRSDYDEDAAALLQERVLAFLERVG